MCDLDRFFKKRPSLTNATNGEGWGLKRANAERFEASVCEETGRKVNEEIKQEMEQKAKAVLMEH
jgi:hypothetical protein